jgi:hypothetical protein
MALSVAPAHFYEPFRVYNTTQITIKKLVLVGVHHPLAGLSVFYDKKTERGMKIAITIPLMIMKKRI